MKDLNITRVLFGSQFINEFICRVRNTLGVSTKNCNFYYSSKLRHVTSLYMKTVSVSEAQYCNLTAAAL